MAVVSAAVVVLLVALTGCENRRGPDPTVASVEAVTGPFAVATTTVGAGHGFGGATIYYPTDTGQSRFGAVAVAPGYTAYQSSISWYGPRVASQGFVVMTIDTLSTGDWPLARADQLLAALDYLTTESTVASRVDPARLATMGWSMGGGGAYEAGKARPSIKAMIGLAPWDNTGEFATNTVPTLVIACEADTVAPVDAFAKVFYDGTPDSTPKSYVEIKDGTHWCVTSPSTTVARSVITWLKRFVDGDTRYQPFLCPPPSSSAISDQRSNCPYG